MRDERYIIKYCEADVIALAKLMNERKIRKIKRTIKRVIIRSIDFLMIMSWMIGACGIDCESNDMRVIFAMILVPMIWGVLRTIAEGEWR